MAENDTDTGDAAEEPRWRGVLRMAAILAVVLAAVLLARAPEPEFLEPESAADPLPAAPTALVLHPVITGAAQRVTLTGTVSTLGQVRVVPQASGVVVEVSDRFRAGALFRADETLARVETADYDLAVAVAEADLAVAQARLLEAKGSPNAAVRNAEAQVAGARARLRLAEVHLDRTRIRLPFDGHVVSAAVAVGQVVTAGQSTLGEVYARNALRVQAQISTADLHSLQPLVGNPAVVVADGRAYDAEVERHSSVVDLETRLASLYLRLLDQEAMEIRPLPGTFVDVTVEGAEQAGVFLLPEASMQINGGLWLVEDRRLVAFKPVSLGYAEDGWMVRAFDPHDGVVVGPVAGARAGLSVEPVDWSPL